MTIKRTIAAATMCAALLAGCGSSSSDSTAASDPTSECYKAFDAYATDLIKNPDMDETDAQRSTLDACTSKDEWTTEAKGQQFEGSVLFAPKVDLDKVHQAFCSGNEDAPACAS